MRRVSQAIFAALLILFVSTGVAVAQFQSTPPDFIAPLTGDEEVPPRATAATGVAQFKLIDDGTAIAYRLIVDNIQNITASHIHLGPKGVNAPVVTFLAGPFPAGGGPFDGHLAEGVIRSSNLIGPLAGQDISTLIQAIRNGGTYVNVHTDDGVAPSNTGPGDFPGGEIRGQIKRARDHSPRVTESTN